MTIQFIEEYLYDKMLKNENYIECTFFDMRVKNNLSEYEIQQFLELSKIKLENMGYKVYFTGEEFLYKDSTKKVEENQYMIAVKGEK